MISLIIYCLSVATILILYYFYKPNEQENDTKVNKSLFNGFLAKFYTEIDETNGKNQINDSFKTYQELSLELKRIGMSRCDVVLGIDFTASNEWRGRKTFNAQSLHKTIGHNRIFNPYQKVISVLGFVLQQMNDIRINAYGFGDSSTKDKHVFSFIDESTETHLSFFDEVLNRYNDLVKKVTLNGPTSFAPIINKSIELVKSRGTYHILFIIADGKVSIENEEETIRSIEEASNYALSIVVIGVGDGPFESMIKFDDRISNRRFDNFQFVDYHKTIRGKTSPDTTFALEALMEIPEQYKQMKKFCFI